MWCSALYCLATSNIRLIRLWFNPDLFMLVDDAACLASNSFFEYHRLLRYQWRYGAAISFCYLWIYGYIDFQKNAVWITTYCEDFIQALSYRITTTHKWTNLLYKLSKLIVKIINIQERIEILWRYGISLSGQSSVLS